MNTTESNSPANTANETKRSKVNGAFLFSLTLLAVVLATSTFLFVSNRALETEIANVRSKSADYDASIAKLQNNPNIVAIETLTTNEASIKKNIRDNEVQKYVSELQKIAKTYRIGFSGFSYQAGKISTSAVATNDVLSATGSDAITKISSLVSAYRTGSGNIFQLSPISSVSGIEQKRTFSAEFLVSGVAK